MIIIIEGPDGAGKTMLANKIAYQNDWPIVHMSYPKSTDEESKMYDMYVDLLHKHKNMIIDRAWYSEMVYGPVMRGKSNILYPDMYTLERLINSAGGGMIIYCTAPQKVLWRRCVKRGEDLVTDYETLRKICDAYRVLMEVPHVLPVVSYEYKDV